MDGGARAGLAVRIDATGDHYFACDVNLSFSTFVVSRTEVTCDGGPCALSSLTLGDGGTAAAAIPREIERKIGSAIGLRMAVSRTAADGSGTVECRVFDPDPRSARTGLQLPAPTTYAIQVPVTADAWIDGGDVGFFVTGGQASFSSMDLLAE
jgi:hypothetical protein